MVTVALGVALGCTREQARSAPAPVRPPLHRGPLTDYVPAAGLHWLVAAKPRALLENPVTSHAIAGLITSAGMNAFATASGVDLRQVPAAVVAGFDYSTLYLASLPPNVAATARARFTQRLVAGAIEKQPHPAIHRVSGVVGQTPETLLTLDESTLAVAVGDPTPSRVVEAFALGKLKSSPSALHGSALRDMPDFAAENLILAFAPGPFPEEWQRAGGGLFASALACAAAVRPLEPASLGVSFVVLGDFQQDSAAAAAALNGAWAQLARSSTGRLLGLDQGGTPQTETIPGGLRFEVVLPVDPLIHGLRAAVLTDVSEILRIAPKPEPKADPTSAPESHPNLQPRSLPNPE